jgi:hypothetical protein
MFRKVRRHGRLLRFSVQGGEACAPALDMPLGNKEFNTRFNCLAV